MQVAVFTGAGAVEIRDEPDPVADPEQVIVDVAACGICTFERRLFSGEKQWYPVSPGHEAAGVVAGLGRAAAERPGTPRVGDLVAIDLLTRCGDCIQCRRGKSNLCRAPQGWKLADGTVSFGGFAGRAVVDADAVYPVGDASPIHAAMCEPIACCVHSLRQGGFRPGDRVAIIGGGFMGRIQLALAVTWGAGRVGVVDVSEDRRSDAVSAGADWVAGPDDAVAVGGPQDVVLVSAMGGVDLAIGMADLGGAVVLYSAFDEATPAYIGADRSHREEVAIVGAFQQNPEDWRDASSLVRSGEFAAHLEPLVTATYPFGHLEEAMRRVTAEPTYRVFVVPGHG